MCLEGLQAALDRDGSSLPGPLRGLHSRLRGESRGVKRHSRHLQGGHVIKVYTQQAVRPVLVSKCDINFYWRGAPACTKKWYCIFFFPQQIHNEDSQRLVELGSRSFLHPLIKVRELKGSPLLPFHCESRQFTVTGRHPVYFSSLVFTLFWVWTNMWPLRPERKYYSRVVQSFRCVSVSL